MKKLYLLALLPLFVPKITLAHCPLCTAGAGALAILAVYLGISSVIVGVMIGAFAIALSMWLARLPKKEYIPYQKPILTILVFLSTVLPIMPLIRHYAPFYLSLWGDYGTLFNNTYTIDLFLAGVPLGVIVVWIAPYLSKWLTKMRGGKQLPYQGIGLTFVLLILVSVIIQLL